MASRYCPYWHEQPGRCTRILPCVADLSGRVLRNYTYFFLFRWGVLPHLFLIMFSIPSFPPLVLFSGVYCQMQFSCFVQGISLCRKEKWREKSSYAKLSIKIGGMNLFGQMNDIFFKWMDSKAVVHFGCISVRVYMGLWRYCERSL